MPLYFNFKVFNYSSTNKRNIKAVFLSLTLTLGIFSPMVLLAQKSNGIAAIVNDEIISKYDFQNRLLAIVAISRLPNTAETYARISKDILKSLIEERIKLQEAKKLKLMLSEAQMKQAKEFLEKQIGLQPGDLGQFLKERGINSKAIDGQIKAGALWGRIVRRFVNNKNLISDEEIDEYVLEAKKNKGKTESRVSEIFLRVPDKSKEEETIQFANRLIKKIQEGSPFSGIARNFSQNPSAKNGGDLGWTLNDKFNTNLRRFIQKLNIGEVTGPFMTEEGIHVLLLRDRRLSRGLEQTKTEKTKINLLQLHLELPANVSVKEDKNIVKKALRLGKESKGCKEFQKTIKKSGSKLSGELGTFFLTEIDKNLKNLVKDLPIGIASTPYRTSEGIIVLMVCSKVKPRPKKTDPNILRRAVIRKLKEPHFEIADKRLLIDLYQRSFIEIKQ